MERTSVGCSQSSWLQAGLDHIDQGISVIDRDLRLVGWNRRFIELMDFPSEMVRVGTAFEEFIRFNAARGEYGPGPVEALVAERVRAARTFVRHYLERTRPNGVVIAVQGMPLAQGGFVTVYTDITERRRAEILIRQHSEELEARVARRTAELRAANEDLRKSEERLRLITDAIPASIAYIDKDASVSFANRRFAELFARSTDEVLGLYERLQPHLAPAFAGTTQTFEHTYPLPGGDALTTHNVLIPELADDGRVLGLFVLSLDVTATKKAEAALRDAQKMTAIGQLAGGLAHDFNNLLQVVVGNLRSLKDEVRADLAEEYVEPAIRAGRRGVDITQRLLAFARRQPLEPQAVNVETIVTRTIGLLRRSLPRSITITATADGSPWAALADSSQLENALLNLAFNARDAMPTGGTLRFHVANRTASEGAVIGDQPAVAGDYVEIDVTDSGTGIDPATLSRAFEPFFTTKRFGMGSGLGLSMVYGFAKQSGGYIRIVSELGKGTCASLLLPRADAAPEAGTPAAEQYRSRGHGELALLAEDNDDVRLVIRRQLLELGYRVIEARDGVEAGGLLVAVPDVSVLVSDVVMPGEVTGSALASLARQVRPDLRVVLISGFTDALDGSTASLDDVAVLRKPFEKEQLMRAIEGWERIKEPTRS